MENQSHNNESTRRCFERYQHDFKIPIEDLKTKRLLDIGANTGEFIRYIRAQLGNHNAFVLEKQENRVPDDRPEWYIVGSGTDIPFADESFELITAHNYITMFVEEMVEKNNLHYISPILEKLKVGGSFYFDCLTSDDLRLYGHPGYDNNPEEHEQEIKIRDKFAEMIFGLKENFTVENWKVDESTSWKITKK